MSAHKELHEYMAPIEVVCGGGCKFRERTEDIQRRNIEKPCYITQEET
jgi:hypothetical protein